MLLFHPAEILLKGVAISFQIIPMHCEGAESVILPNCIDGPIEETYEIVDQFATEGLRTLVYAYKTLSNEELKVFNENLEKAKQNMTNR